jgi:hypothetical protein
MSADFDAWSRARPANDIGRRSEESEVRSMARIDFGPYSFPDPTSIPRREWLYGRHYIRGAVSASIGAPGRAKSTTSLTEIVAMSVGRDLLTGEQLSSGPLRAAYLNGEETQDELDRRVAAILQLFTITREDCGDRLFVNSTRDEPVKVASPGPGGNAVTNKVDVDGLRDWCARRQIDVLVVDPLISFHSVNENVNGDMDVVCKDAFGVIAGKSRAIELVHHPRKLQGSESNVTVDDARGASAILAAVREARTFNYITASDALRLGIREEQRRLHIRIDNGKSNMGSVGNARWLKLEVENLPNGDTVACITQWSRPDPFDGLSIADLKVVQNVVQDGAFRESSQAKEWLGWWMAENLPSLNITARYSDNPKDKTAVSRLSGILKTWVKNRDLKIVTRQDKNRRDRSFYAIGELVGAPSRRFESEPTEDE